MCLFLRLQSFHMAGDDEEEAERACIAVLLLLVLLRSDCAIIVAMIVRTASLHVDCELIVTSCMSLGVQTYKMVTIKMIR